MVTMMTDDYDKHMLWLDIGYIGVCFKESRENMRSLFRSWLGQFIYHIEYQIHAQLMKLHINDVLHFAGIQCC